MTDVIQRFMKNGQIITLPRKEKDKIELLKLILADFNINKSYSEREVNEILQKYYDDFVVLRRYLVDYAMLRRDKEGRHYWVNKGDDS
ncbi:MAG: DUF2087 domain-containing protein [Staphylococcus rostri]|uniref:DUF2087 domain-containing protein n=1 Tax=Staphylococcus rostri TaxID=522262 RepID=UPI0026E04869|nr:DUF2087 domain-containing protein [Staphylococcus rostri]MDO5374955.1 DUF2087 domain-containing protein [Staphylococcus rostri]